MDNYPFKMSYGIRRGGTYLPEYISKFIRDENGLTIGSELHGSRLFREFAIQGIQ
jgi:hypothetical protein